MERLRDRKTVGLAGAFPSLEGLTLGHRLETIKDFKFRLSIQNKVYLLSMFKNDPLSFSYLLQKVSMKLGLNETFKNVKFLYFKGI